MADSRGEKRRSDHERGIRLGEYAANSPSNFQPERSVSPKARTTTLETLQASPLASRLRLYWPHKSCPRASMWRSMRGEKSRHRYELFRIGAGPHISTAET